MTSITWTSEAFQLNADTCADVTADEHGVVFGQQGEAWLHNLHLSPEQAAGLGDALVTASVKAREAGAQS